MSSASEAYLALFGPTTDKEGLCIWFGEKSLNAAGQLIWKPVWQAFDTNQIMNNPPTVAVCGDTVYVFYPSTSNQTNYLFYNTCNTGTLEWSDQEILKFSDPDVPGGLASIPTATGVGAATFNGQVYVFWQGVNNVGSGSANGTLFYRTMNDATYYQINAQQSVDGESAGVVMSNCPAAVAFNNQLYVFYEGPGEDDWMWYISSSDGNSWSTSARVSNYTGMSTSASPVVFTNTSSGQQELYVFHQGYGGNEQLWFNVLDTEGNWAGDRQVPNVTMSAVPSAGVYDGMLYVFYQGSNTSTFWYVYSSDGSTWSDPRQVADLKVSYTPSIVEFNSMLYCMMQGPGNDKTLWYSTFTPGSSSTAVIPMTALPTDGNSTQYGPTLFEFGGSLYCFAVSASINGAILVSELNENGWGAQSQIISPGSGLCADAPPVVVTAGQYSYIFLTNSYDSNLYFNQCTNPTIENYNQASIEVPGASITSSPSALMFNSQLYVFYQTPATQMPCNLAYNVCSTPDNAITYPNLTAGWSGSQLVPLNTVWDVQPNGVGPAAVVFGGELYVFYLGNYENSPSDKDYFLCYYRLASTGEWSGQYNFPAISYSSQNAGNFKPGPVVTPFVYNNDELVVVYQDGNGYLYFVTSSDGSNWSQPQELSGQVPQATPPIDGKMTDWIINLGFFLAT